MTIGVLALQGDFAAHCEALKRLGVAARQVRSSTDLDGIDGLIIPGGESTTMLKLLQDEGMFESLQAFGSAKPIFGTCAGAILLAKNVTSPEQPSLKLVDIDVERNAYGRQIDSRVVMLDGKVEAVFIRAPIIRRVGDRARILLRYNGDPVLVQDGLHLVSTFHPELTANLSIHQMFVDKVAQLTSRKNSPPAGPAKDHDESPSVGSRKEPSSPKS